ncbi:hypothetical protein P886_2247 [Alteromonadaceae bacterium 2753L.S.0a.02]|nr:hypothetical protein P886_2247 [Alteromonadaceae bacterium 2753L.S.0a.02]
MSQPSLPEYIASLQAPTPDLAKLSFCASKPAKVAEWANQLRATQIAQTSAALYKCLPEVARLKTNFDSRLAILEAIRPVTHHAIEGLTRDFLQQPINLSQNAQKTAIVAQAIQKAMIEGYVRCILEICVQKRFKQTIRDSLAQALHRAITGIGLIFFRTYQLYTQPPAGYWQQLHSLFQIADYFDLLAAPVKDPQLKTRPASNVQTAYVRVLMLATARLNQLNQNDIAHIYYALESWAQYVRLHPSVLQDKDNFYLLNLHSDSGPVYKSRFNGSETDRVLELDFRVLVNQLAKQSPSNADNDLEVSAASAITVPQGFPGSLLEHLVGSWSSIAQRRQERRAVQNTAEVCVGMVNAHFMVCGEQSFEDFSNEGGLGDGFDTNVVDMLGLGVPGSSGNRAAPDNMSYAVTVQNVSAGGCCLLWKGKIPSRLKAGELIGLKEQGRHSWGIGAVRWVRQYRGESQLGIQLLANHPKPYGIAQTYDMGGYSDYMRAFYLPAAKNGNTPASLLTASAPFKELDKVKLFDGEQAVSAKLNKIMFATGSIQQFMFNTLEVPQQKRAATLGASPPKSSTPFDEDWD